MVERNLCRSCGQDFGTLTVFDRHRADIKINASQKLVGKCSDPQLIGLVKLNGVWYDESGLRQLDKMQKMRDQRDSARA